MPESKDVHDGEEWSEMAIDYLRAFISVGASIEEVAAFLCRSTNVPEVEAKARELGLTVRHVSDEPHKVEVAHADGHWLTQISDGFFSFDCATLMQLIEAVRSALPGERLLFVVDYTTIEYHHDAQIQIIEARAKSGSTVITSVEGP